MEFWGAKVKSGEPLEVDPGDGCLLHLSQACLGEAKKDKGNESICLFVKVGKQKLVLGTLSSEKFPQLSFDLMFEKRFVLSHNSKNGNLEEDFPVVPRNSGRDNAHSGKYESQAKQAAKPDGTAAKRVKIVEPNKVEDTDEDVDKDASLNDVSSDEDEFNEAKAKVDGEAEISEGDESSGDDSCDDEDSSEYEDEETPKKAEASKKRPMESAKKTLAPEKKAKFITPEKTEVIAADGKKGGGHVATPHPSKKDGTTKQQTLKSGGAYPCKSCNRSFGSENGLQSHTKAKHSDGK
uniref:C2H2-type domain-containing protein n=1 Tax=Fagus sylvatica TaxID=28930 RepID=A0A2N9HQ40_FAGSY